MTAADVVSPVVDVTRFFLVSDLTFSVKDVALNAAIGPMATSDAIPFGEIWIVRSVSIRPQAVLGAGVTLTWRPYAVSPTGNYRLAPVNCSGTVGARPACGWDLDDQVFSSGWQFGIWQESLAGAGAASTIQVEYQRLLA